ncbi:sensor histidine kinase [Clostridium oryzae]|uniref:Putative sensor-like histidine kinase n=1 Tax=Clostridium oryzae TaxID=1450648 RepID=A0A1V4IIX1_9CLOT|nr:histidine kinase [Clostridium oryzae]OPJ59859.1 putative sensor-like histidine kinase [Clostridium oryzae]
MKTIKQLMIRIYNNLNISAKMSALYMAFLTLSLIIATIIHYQVNYNFTIKKQKTLSMQTLYSLKSNIYNMMDNVSFNSRIIMANIDVQDILTDGNHGNSLEYQRKIYNYLSTLIDSMQYIQSVYVFDNYNNYYGVDKNYLKRLKLKRLNQADWYSSVIKLDGYYILKLNGIKIFKLKNAGKNTISLIRVVNSTTSERKIGVIMVNISEEAFENCYKEITNRYKTSIAILNENNELVSSNNQFNKEEMKQILNISKAKGNSLALNQSGQSYIYSSMKLKRYGWKIVIGIPMSELKKEFSIYGLISLITIILNSILLLIGTIFISKLISNPIHRLLQAMKNIENGKFTIMAMKTGNDEIGQLKNGYNIMIKEIQNLIEKTVWEQKTIRKAELNVLQAQIKPHFLYNTLNAMEYLALAGKNKELYDALEAMGSYYKKSLSKGKEIISLEEEVEIVKDYVFLQQLRYGNILTVHYDLNPETLKYNILKLILQPLVENSIYHGIMPKGEHGDIYISSKLRDNKILIMVEDNGIGMTEEELNLMKSQKINDNLDSFGFRGTVERLKIYYDCSDVYTIESSKGTGTKITLIIPKKRGEQNE